MGSTDGNIAKRKRPHLLIIPFEEEGHFSTFLDLVYYLSSPDVTITFCSSRRRVEQLRELQRQGSFNGTDLHLVELTDDVSKPADKAGAMPMIWEIPNIMKGQFQPYREKLLAETDPAAKPTCLIADALLDWSEELAEQLQIPRYFYYTCSAWIPYLIFKMKVEKWSGNHAPDEMVEILEGFTIPAKEIPFILFKLTRIENVAGHIINSLEELDGADTVAAIRSFLPPLATKPGAKVAKYWSIGPTKHISSKRSSAVNSADAESKALKWLDEQAAASIVYIAFGTMAHIPPDIITQLARGLEISGVPFLWVLRHSGTSTTHISSLLPPGFLDRTAKQGFVETRFAPQTQILDHPSIGGFLSHCGWNSVTEGVLAGVPFLTWPFHGDQPANSRIVVEKLKVGISVRQPSKGFVVPGEDVASAFKRLMFEPEGDDVRKNSARYKDAAQSAVKEGGSSFRNLKELADEVLTC